MRSILIVLLILTITIGSLGSESGKGNCQKGWEKFGSKCYKIFSNQRDDVIEMTFEQAKEFCEKQNPKSGSLVSIHSEEEQDFLTSYLGQPGIKNTVYIGLQRPSSYASHQWLDGTKVDYQNWVPGEPNNANSNERCAQMQSHEVTAGKWNDIPCDALKDFICQTDQDSTLPEVSSTVECIICPNHTVKYRESCYSTYSNGLNWYEAEQTCNDDGGHLVSISDNFEMAFLRQLTRGKFSEFWIGLRANIVHSRLYEHKDRHHLAWSDHRPVHHLTWDEDEPKYIAEEDLQCVEMNDKRLWEVSDCADEKPFVCIKHPNAFAKPTRAEGYCPSNLGVSSKLIDVGHDNCYFIGYDGSESFTGAEVECRGMGGELAFFKNLDEIKSLSGYISPYATKQFWVGIRKTIGGFKSLDNEDFDKSLWEKGEPNNLSSEKCVSLYAQAMKYYNSPCYMHHRYICEIPKVLEIDYDSSKESVITESGSGDLEGYDNLEGSGTEGSGAEGSGIKDEFIDDEDSPYDEISKEINTIPETTTESEFIFVGIEDNHKNTYKIDNEI